VLTRCGKQPVATPHDHLLARTALLTDLSTAGKLYYIMSQPVFQYSEAVEIASFDSEAVLCDSEAVVCAYCETHTTGGSRRSFPCPIESSCCDMQIPRAVFRLTMPVEPTIRGPGTSYRSRKGKRKRDESQRRTTR
jgi:hypothetical protein